jgi:hypothetical protein
MHRMAVSQDDNLVCPHCIAPIGRFDHFCPRCGGPVTAHASNDPLGQVFSVGRAYRKASETPRLIVVIGIWLIFGSQVPMLLFGVFLTLSNLFRPGHKYAYGDGSSMTPISDGILLELMKLLVVIALLVLYVAIIRKVTVRYIRARREAMHNPQLQSTGAARGFPVIPVPRERGPGD